MTIKPLDRFNAWYDALKEPKRFLSFLFTIILVLVLFFIPKTQIIGFIFMCIIGFVAMYRASKMK